MIEYILVAGFMFVLGLVVGRNIGHVEAKQHLMHYMQVVSNMHNVINDVHVKHGITEEVAERLREHGIEVKRVYLGG